MNEMQCYCQLYGMAIYTIPFYVDRDNTLFVMGKAQGIKVVK